MSIVYMLLYKSTGFTVSATTFCISLHTETAILLPLYRPVCYMASPVNYWRILLKKSFAAYVQLLK